METGWGNPLWFVSRNCLQNVYSGRKGGKKRNGVLPPLGVLRTPGPGTKAPSKKAFICCPVQCIFWEALLLCICWKRYTIYQCQGRLVSNTVRLQSKSPWNNRNSLSLHVNLFYKAHKPSLPMNVSQLQAPNICLRCKEKLDAWKKKRFSKLKPAMVI